MKQNTPKALHVTLGAQMLGVFLLCLSLFASTPPSYLITIGLGVGAVLIGCLAFLVLLKGALKKDKEAMD